MAEADLPTQADLERFNSGTARARYAHDEVPHA